MNTQKDVLLTSSPPAAGTGNAAMEVAQALFPLAGSVNMFGHSPMRFSDQTHYPGVSAEMC